ncbi:MAG: ATP-binding protein [Burkholderiales bacterium]
MQVPSDDSGTTIARQAHSEPDQSRTPRRPAGSVWIVPFAALALFVAAIAALLWFVLKHEAEIELSNLRRDTQFAELAITRRILAHQDLVDRIAGAISSGQDALTLTDQAQIYLRQNPELRNVLWTSPAGSISWAAPSWKDASSIARERPPLAERERMLRLTSATGRSTYSDPYRDYQDEPYIEYHSPVVRQGRFLGTISASLSLRAAMQRLVPLSVSEKYRLSLIDASGRELFRPDDGRETYEWLTQSVSLTLPWRDLDLTATSYKTDSLVGRTILMAIIALVTIVLAWSLWSLRRRVEMQAGVDRALMASHERFVTVLDALDAGVAVSDFDTRELLFCNESFARIFPGHTLGSNTAKLETAFTPIPSQAIAREMLLTADGRLGAVHKLEVRDESRDLWYALRVRAVRWVDGRAVRMTMISDITERKLAEERSRVQQEKLLLTSRLMSVGEMASTLAHEINQPLSAIANYNMGAVRRLKSDHWKKEDLVSALEKSAAQAERAGRVVHRVREFLRRREPVREPGSINQIIAELAELVEIEADKAQVELVLEPGADLPPVFADRVMVEQVLVNLIKNGMEAMRAAPLDERRLVVRTFAVAVSDQPTMIEIQVIDRGHGITPEVERELFSPFFTTKDNGMGMGLNICRSIVEMHEGHLWFSRGPDGGSIFHFTLPLAETTTELAA